LHDALPLPLAQNGTKAAITDLVSKLNKASVPANTEVVVAPTALHIGLVQGLLTNKSIEISAQNSLQFKAGAYTGEIAPELLVDFGLAWTILGHSERRQIFHTDDKTVGEQVKLALAAGLKVIACVGETLQEREANQTQQVVERQLKAIADNVNDWSKVVIAYEPVWAIGTGKVATPAQAQEVHKSTREWLNSYKSGIGSSTRIIYGGSVKGDNAAELATQPDIDGFLVGGASLKADEFVTIFQARSKAAKL
jgi:triosephosphate isomerase